ncbi:hypothetical protein FKM82_031404 [Ascaphus truei]
MLVGCINGCISSTHYSPCSRASTKKHRNWRECAIEKLILCDIQILRPIFKSPGAGRHLIVHSPLSEYGPKCILTNGIRAMCC